MPIVAKNLPRAIYEDCVKEEKETVDTIGDFGKIVNGICMRIAREILSQKKKSNSMKGCDANV